MNKSLALLTLFSATGIALSLATGSGMAEPSTPLPGIIVAADDKPAYQPAPSEGGVGKDVMDPKVYPETPAEVAECEKSWDPATQMSREEYAKACQRSLKYFPEKAQ
jgi:hypothetical protein